MAGLRILEGSAVALRTGRVAVGVATVNAGIGKAVTVLGDAMSATAWAAWLPVLHALVDVRFGAVVTENF